MDLYLLDKDYKLLGGVEVFTSFIWDRRYYEHGTFELHCHRRYFQIINSAKYLYRNDREEIGVIRAVYYRNSEQGIETYCTGVLGEALLDDRVIDKPYKGTGTPEELSFGIVKRFVSEPDIVARRIDNIFIGELSGIGEKVQKQVTGSPVGEACYEIEKTQEMSHRLRYDFKQDTLTFEVWQGKDRRESQDENSWAIFSEEFKNVQADDYSRNAMNFANFAYVAGEGDGDDRVVEEVDIIEEGEERREIYVDARDLQNALENKYPYSYGNLNLDPVYQYTEEEYREILRQRGLEKLSEHRLVENMSGTIISNENLEYMKDFDLGDYCTFKNEYIGIEIDSRITEIIEVYESGGMRLTITFGQDSVSSIRKLIKQEAGR